MQQRCLARACAILLGCVGSFTWASEQELAGPAQLAELDHEIAALQAALQSQQLLLVELHQQQLQLLVDAAQGLMTQQPVVAPPATWERFQPWYLESLQLRQGFSPLAPISGWPRHWQLLRDQERPQWDAFEQLSVACHHLERLRRRLALQLSAPAPLPPP